VPGRISFTEKYLGRANFSIRICSCITKFKLRYTLPSVFGETVNLGLKFEEVVCKEEGHRVTGCSKHFHVGTFHCLYACFMRAHSRKL
jgi:hypothetical protein